MAGSLLTYPLPCSSRFFSSSILRVVKLSWSSAPVGMELVRGSLCDWDFHHVDTCTGKFHSKGRWYCGPSGAHATWGWNPELHGASARTAYVKGAITASWCPGVPPIPSLLPRGVLRAAHVKCGNLCICRPPSHIRCSRGDGFCCR